MLDQILFRLMSALQKSATANFETELATIQIVVAIIIRQFFNNSHFAYSVEKSWIIDRVTFTAAVFFSAISTINLVERMAMPISRWKVDKARCVRTNQSWPAIKCRRETAFVITMVYTLLTIITPRRKPINGSNTREIHRPSDHGRVSNKKKKQKVPRGSASFGSEGVKVERGARTGA